MRRTTINLTQLDWRPERVQALIDVAFDVARWNGNKRGVRDEVYALTDSLDVVRSYPVKSHKNDETNWGCCYYFSYWDGVEHRTVGSSVIYVNPNAPEKIETLAHEIAHALTAGVHGFTWRKMYAMLLPLTYDAVELSLPGYVGDDPWRHAIPYRVFNAVRRYGVRYESGVVGQSNASYGTYAFRAEKIDTEVRRHMRSARRCYDVFAERLRESE